MKHGNKSGSIVTVQVSGRFLLSRQKVFQHLWFWQYLVVSSNRYWEGMDICFMANTSMALSEQQCISFGVRLLPDFGIKKTAGMHQCFCDKELFFKQAQCIQRCIFMCGKEQYSETETFTAQQQRHSFLKVLLENLRQLRL